VTPDELAAIHAAAFTEAPRPWSAAEFADLLASPLCFLCAEPGGFALGRAVAGEAELLTIAVRPEAQGQGKGGALLAAFLAEAARRGASRCFLEVSERNAPAIALYRRAGFALAARRRHYYVDRSGPADALMMEKGIGAGTAQRA
jgi:ribosomal-protein-alanine N-acetyltransferase